MRIIIYTKKLKIGQKNNLKKIHHSKNLKDSELGANTKWHDAYFQVEKKYFEKSKLNYKMQHIHTDEEDGVINLKSKSSNPQNI